MFEKMPESKMPPLWKLKILALFGLAKKYQGFDLGTKDGDKSVLIEGYLVAGTFYVTREHHF